MTAFLTVWISLLAAVPVLGAYSGKLLLVSFDGFRWDYLKQVKTPNFDILATQGVKLPYMNNSFVTKTFPNHFTIVTGLFEESHGIIDNYMYDPEFKASFNMGTKESRWWDGGEPIWVTAKKQGLKTGTYYWPGSEVEIRGYRPDYWLPYHDDTPYPQRVDTVIDWFTKDNVSMATLYYPEPDHTGHLFGPDAPEVRAQVRRMDGVLGYLMQSMKDAGLDDKVNLIVTSDHGMTSVDYQQRVVDISEHVNMSLVERVPSYGPVALVQPIAGQLDTVYQALSNAPHTTVYKKQDMPERFHYSHNRRISDIVVIGDEGWLITTNRTKWAHHSNKGTHGFDNALMSMKPIFFARGPDIKVNAVADPIKNVDIYPLMCKLLNIDPSPNNGSLTRTRELLKTGSTGTGSEPSQHGLWITLSLCTIVSCWNY